jgi:hypothetical protein
MYVLRRSCNLGVVLLDQQLTFGDIKQREQRALKDRRLGLNESNILESGRTGRAARKRHDYNFSEYDKLFDDL